MSACVMIFAGGVVTGVEQPLMEPLAGGGLCDVRTKP